MIQTLWKRRVVKQDESNGDPEFIATIGLEGKLIIYWNIDKRQSWKWIKVCKAFKNPILEFNVGNTSFENKGKAYGAQVISTTRGGMTWSMD